jgi:hypothetical protein
VIIRDRVYILCAVLIVLLCALLGNRSHGSDLTFSDGTMGPLQPFGCAPVRVVDNSLECPPSAGFSCIRQITKIWTPEPIKVNDFVWFNDSDKTVYVSRVELISVPEPPCLLIMVMGLFIVGQYNDSLREWVGRIFIRRT